MNYEFLSEPVGGGKFFANRMPYVAYIVCEKNQRPETGLLLSA